MPGIVQANVSLGVMPQFLSEAFIQEREYLANVNEYADGASQRELVLFASRRKWILKPKAHYSVIVAIKNFFIARKGGMYPFYFYDYTESSPKGNYDATGVDTNGRFLVRFEGPWNQQKTVGQIMAADCRLVELIEGIEGEIPLSFENPPTSGWLLYF